MVLHNKKLRFQINLLMGSAIIFILIIMFFFYFHLYNMMESKNRVYVSNVMQQVKENILMSTQDVSRIGTTVAYYSFVQEFFTTKNFARRIEVDKNIVNLIHSIVNDNSNIVSIKLINENIESTYLSSNMIEESKIINHLNDSVQNGTLQIPTFVTIPKGSQGNQNSYYCYIIPSFSIQKEEKLHTKIGTVYLLCKTQRYRDIIQKLKLSKGSVFMIVDENNRIIESNGDEEQGTVFNIDEQVKKNKLIIQTNEIEGINWKIVNSVSESEFSSDLKSIGLLVLIVCGVILMLLFGISFVLTRSVTKPLNQIVKSIITIGDKNIKQRLDVKINNEIGVITVSINSMLDKIEDMTKKIFQSQEKLYEMELRKNIASLAALQSQINPHFLYNTLECIKSIALVNDVDEIVEISTSMASIFRYSIKSNDYVTVRNEIEIINEYLEIIDIRFCGKYSIIIDVDERMMENIVLKMLLQPIVENAIYHGLEKKEGNGTLKISGRIENDTMVFCVEDDGKGIAPEELKTITELIEKDGDIEVAENKKGIGLRNVNRRIKLYLGNNYGLKLSSEYGKGTVVTIILPGNSLICLFE